MRARVLLAVLCSLLAVWGAEPVGAQGDDDGGGGVIPAAPTVGSLLPDLDQLAGESIAAGIQNPDEPHAPLPTQVALGPDGTAGSAETNTRLAGGVLRSEVIVSVGDTRGVAIVNATICPDDAGKVSGTITLNISGPGDKEQIVTARVAGTVNDKAELASSSVNVGAAKGEAAASLKKFAKQLMKNAESAWRGGYCVEIDVSEGQSGVVQPGVKVKIAATARPRFGGGRIKGPITAKKTAGQKKVEPGSSSDSPARFLYHAPTSKPGSGSVQLRSVSRRGIGTADLEYSTETDLKLDGNQLGNRWTGTKCDGIAGVWDVTITGPRYSATGSFTLDSEPEEGQSVSTVTPLIQFRTADGLGYRESFAITFYDDGANSPHPQFAGSPVLEIDGTGLELQTGSFCS